MAISYSKLGETHTALGNLPQALTFFEDQTKLFEELHEAYPQNVSFKNGLAISYWQLGSFYKDKKSDVAAARWYFEQCRQSLQELTESYPAYVEFNNNLSEVQNDLTNLDK